VRITADGSKVFFAFTSGVASPSDPTTERGVYVINADGSGLRQVAGPTAIAALLRTTPDRVSPSTNGPPLDVSANGARIVFGATANGQDHLFAANGDGSGLHELIPGITYVNHAVLSADGWFDRIGFASLGTNDLLQYALAVDRGNPALERYRDSMHPALLRLIRMAVEAATKAGIELSVCGEMAGDPAAALALVGLGIRSLSMSAPSLAAVRRSIRANGLAGLKEAAADALAATSAADARARFTPLVAG
jgi:hypothetical protein